MNAQPQNETPAQAQRPVSKWTDKRLRVGWTIRTKTGKLAKVTWLGENGCLCYKLIPE